MRPIWIVAMAAYACAAQEPSLPVNDGAPLLTIEVRGFGDLTGARLMFINAQGSDCRRTEVLPLDSNVYDPRSGILTMGNWASQRCWCEDPHASMAGFAVLAPDRAVAYIPNQRKRARLPYSLCRRDAEPYVVQLRPRREVAVNVWALDTSARRRAQDELVNVDWILSKELAGITLNPKFRTPGEKDVANLMEICGKNDSEDECCAKAAESKFYQPGLINLFYGIGESNFACRADVSDAVFVRSVPVLGDAGHELSHKLGLFQSDNHDDSQPYREGHTTGRTPRFDEQNVMWERTQQLKHRLSPGQAFWMSQSCTSFLTSGNCCLSCPPDSKIPSPCPHFADGASAREGESPKVCPAPPVTELVMADGNPIKGDLPETIFCSREELKASLGERYSVLKKHKKGRRNLELGSVTKGDFEDRWMPQFHLRKVNR
jgi:hypothetical protein